MTCARPQSRTDAEIVIVGGGLAGLSLACHLLESGLGERRLLVLEAREAYRHDRYWCSWSTDPHPFRDCVAHSWSRWLVRAEGASHVQSCPSMPYRCIPSGALYAAAERRIAQHPTAALRFACPVATVRAAGGRAEVVLDDGEVLRADRVFDSRLAPLRSAAAGEVEWVQDFIGWRVRTDEPRFDPHTVTLMDFVPGSDDVRFVYVLPFSEREALVESTAFAPCALPSAEHEACLRRYLRTLLGDAAWSVVETERGRVPMSTRRLRTSTADPRIVSIGTAGGLVKPSTGYSFEAVQRWSRAVASEIAAGRPVRQRLARGRRALAMDRMFLAFLRRHPERMPGLFARMFERVPAEVLIRFLSDRASLRDAAQVAAALPVLPMLGEAVRSFRLWARSA